MIEEEVPMEVSEVKQVDNDSDINAADAAENYRIAGSRQGQGLSVTAAR